ncbi:MAG: tRNA dihydrouridine synthase DusB [Proteobacteria bacterium]|nr:tRNA dihydrouridine synthase DusB [Desulfobulbaceae bacterium]MBU4151505.1 tRNA dihydrouridine synthase DusB [Pseudomonadota bacterium]MDP2105405.1 tRNA dihydrouridine synthase DusB [Desulfobulbaceae bacterium]
MRIGSVLLDNPFILAPLAGYTDLPFRLLCREYGAGCCFSEMISCHGLTYQQEKTHAMLFSLPEERPVAIQLFGGEPEVMGQAAALVNSHPIDIIDINMGCPVKKVVKKLSGSALMKYPLLAEQIIRQVVANTDKPVTVKFRSGWTHDRINAPEFARMAEGAGAAAVTVHARTWSDGFGGTVDWSVIAAVKRAVSIPVIGNGDLASIEEGREMMSVTGCDGVMIGRAALGAPWIFSPEQLPVTMVVRTKALIRHLSLIEQFLPADRMLGRIKSTAIRYFKGAHNGATIRNQIFAVQSFAELCQLIQSVDSDTGCNHSL